jgi:predicted Zn-dependent protease
MNDGGNRMVKFGAAAVCLALYAAISTWIVAGAGEEYRKTYRELIARKPTPPETSPVDPGTPASELKEPTRTPEKAPVPPTESTPKGLTAEPAPATHTDKPIQPKPEHSPGKTSPEPHTAPAPVKALRALDPFWFEPDQKRIWDFGNFKDEDEAELGVALNRMVLNFCPEIVDGPLPKRLEDAARPYLVSVNRKNVKYSFTVLNSPLLNVFSLPGGYIYVTKGLFDWIAEDEDYALGFILAHEIAHVDFGHAINCLTDPDIKRYKFGAGLLFFSVVIPGGYKEAQEYEADRWALTRTLALGRTRYEALAFLRRLEDYAKVNGFENKRRNPNDDPKVFVLDNHIRTHPIPRDRLAAAKTFTDGLLNPKH